MNETTPNNPLELGLDDRARWEEARKLLEALGRVPPSFTTPVRMLLLDQRERMSLSPASQFLTTRLLKSPTVKAMFYYLTLALHGDKVSNSAYLSSSDLVRLYEPSAVAAVIAMIYIYKKVSTKGKLANTVKWQQLTTTVAEDIELAGHLGKAVPALGIKTCILAGGLRQIIQGAFIMADADLYNRYKNHLNSKGVEFDRVFEEELFGCTHIELAGNALQMLGFGIEAAFNFMYAFGEQTQKDPEVNQEAYEYCIADEWIDALKVNGAQPDRTHLGQYYPTEKDMHKLLYETNEIREKGSEYSWLTRTKDDINPSATPQLYQEFLMELQGTEALEEFYKENLPEEVLSELSSEDLKELTNPGGDEV